MSIRIIDLSHRLYDNMPAYPGTPQTSINSMATIGEHGFNETFLQISSHVGTHIDAPSHILKSGRSLDQFDPGRFYGRAKVIDMSKGRNIQINKLESLMESIEDVDFILFNTGWHQQWESQNYFNDYPVIDTEVFELLAKHELKGIGLDTPSADYPDSVEYPNHQIIFKNNLIIIENLANLNGLPEKKLIFSCFPLSYKAADGCSVRAVAIIE